MQVKVLFDDRFRILSAADGDECLAEDFLLAEDNYFSSRQGLLTMLEQVARSGLEGVPTKWHHEANKQLKVLEFIKGDLRLFFFKGAGRDIAICCGGLIKKTTKADASLVNLTAALRSKYFAAMASGTLLEIDDE